MSNTLSQLQPTAIWKHFSQLNAIPRASKKEEQVIQFMQSFGKDLGLETMVDETGNVLIKKPASLGKEQEATVILQGHLDMVQQKNTSTKFDFATQGINMYIEGDWVKAKGTTLGADNGIGVAAIMSVLADSSLIHPPIEALFTIDEEVSMTGAMGVKKGFLKGDILLNLDSEEDDALTIGSAGGVDVAIQGKYKPESPSEDFTFFQLSLKGLSGGHSGVDINKGKGHAIKLLNRVLFELDKQVGIRISSIIGGNMTSAIPRECTACIAVEQQHITTFKKAVNAWRTILKKENQDSDPTLLLSAKKLKISSNLLPNSIQKKIVACLYTCPNGIYRMMPALPNLVQSSNNIGKIKVEDGIFKINCHTRSFIESERNDLVNAIQNTFLPLKAKVSEISPYPGWNPKPNNFTLATMKSVYADLYGQAPDVFAIHAGLECGILSETFPHLDIVSFGPNIKGAHSPDEALQISSTQKFWQYLTSVLAAL